eukprot:11572354-Alexandrium_andersonii.AAC.1
MRLQGSPAAADVAGREPVTTGCPAEGPPAMGAAATQRCRQGKGHNRAPGSRSRCSTRAQLHVAAVARRWGSGTASAKPLVGAGLESAPARARWAAERGEATRAGQPSVSRGS